MRKLFLIALPILLLFSCSSEGPLPDVTNGGIRDSLRTTGVSADSVVLGSVTVAPGNTFTVRMYSNLFQSLTSANQFRIKVGEVLISPFSVYSSKSGNKTMYTLTGTMTMSPGTYGVQLVFNVNGSDIYRKATRNISVQTVVKNCYMNVVNLMALRPNSLSTAESGNFAFRIKEFNGSSFIATSSSQTRSYSTTGGWTPNSFTWNLSSEIMFDRSNRYYIQLLKNGVFVREMEIPFSSLSEGTNYLEIQSSSDFNIAYDFKVGLTFNWK